MTTYEGSNVDMVDLIGVAVDGDVFFLINGDDNPKKAYMYKNGQWSDNKIEAIALEKSLENGAQLETIANSGLDSGARSKMLKIKIPGGSEDASNVNLRLALHHGQQEGDALYNELFFNNNCKTDFSDIRFCP